MDKSIDELLSGNSEPVAAVEEVTEAVELQPETTGQPRDEHGRFASKEETGVETPEPQAAPEPVVPTEQANPIPQEEYSALKAERRKRQELENRLQAMEQRLQAKPANLTPEEEIDFWENPQAFMAKMTGNLRTQILSDLRQEQQIERLNQSEATARQKHADYEDAFAAFQQAVQLNPRLAQELSRSEDPGEFAYSKGKAALALEQYGSIDALLAAERAKWEAETRAYTPTVTLPSTTAADGSVGSRSGPEWGGPTPLTDILQR